MAQTPPESSRGTQAALGGRDASLYGGRVLPSNARAAVEAVTVAPAVTNRPGWWVALAWAAVVAAAWAAQGLARDLAGPPPSPLLTYVTTALTAVGHWLLVRRSFRRAFWWLLTEVLGSFGVTIALLALLVGSQALLGREAQLAVFEWYSAPAVVGIISGVVIGSLQWLYLVWRVRDAWVWIVVTSAAYAVASADQLQPAISEAASAYASSDTAIFLANAMVWTAVELARGAALVWLVRRPRAQPEQPTHTPAQDRAPKPTLTR